MGTETCQERDQKNGLGKELRFLSTSSRQCWQHWRRSQSHGRKRPARIAKGEKSSMTRDIDAVMEERGRRKVATGIWLYDRTTPMELTVWAKPAHLASSRFDEDDHFIETSPIPETKDGFLYFYWPGGFREYMTIEEAKAAADAEPWGPIKWD